jgi:hypothetical protein
MTKRLASSPEIYSGIAMLVEAGGRLLRARQQRMKQSRLGGNQGLLEIKAWLGPSSFRLSIRKRTDPLR